MLVPLSWLREFVDVELEPEALAERLTLLGMEVQGIERIGADWASVVVGELLEVVPHPTTSRLSLTRVAVGDGRAPLSIVCGATNIAAGQHVPVALPGAVLPGGRRIDVTRIADAESQGMLCSGAELGLTSDADGILILPAETTLGRPLQDLLGDVVLDVDVKPNRGDALSIVGLAREVAAATRTQAREPLIEVPESGDQTSDHVSVEVQDVLRCPRFVARYLDGVSVAPSPLEVQVRLMAAGIRPVSNIVDASNYTMVELGKPVHTYDADLVASGRIVVRAAAPGERLETLDHAVRELDPDTLVIADPERPLGIAGVMGGADSEVDDGTTAVIVESAIFDPVAIRRTARRYGLRSEASVRFEKGQEARLARLGADRTAQLIVRWAGGRAAVGAVDTDPVEPPLSRVTFRPQRVSRLLGAPIEAGEMRELLGRVLVRTEPAGEGDGVPVIEGERAVPLDPAAAAEALVAIVPSHRRDLVVEADIAEEVARVRGYDTLPGRLPDTEMPGYHPDPRRFVEILRQMLSARGLSEVVTHSLVSAVDQVRIGIARRDPATIRAANPVSVDHAELRRSLVPELVRVLVDNERQRRSDVAIFEVGNTHRGMDGRPEQRLELGILLAGDADPPSWAVPSRSADVSDVKGLVEWLVARLTDGAVRYEPAPIRLGVDHPGRTALVVAVLPSGHRMELGRVGELDPRYLAAVGARAERVAVATIDLDGLDRIRTREIRVGALERVPAAERDISVVVPTTRPAADVEATIRAAGGPLLRSVWLFDRYEGPPLAGDEVALGYRLRFEPGERAFEESDIEGVIGSVVESLRDRLGARLRA